MSSEPTHFGGDGLYDTTEEKSTPGVPAVLEQDPQRSVWEFARRNHVPALLAIGGLAVLLTALVRRSMGRS